MDHCANFDDMTIYLPDLLESGESHVDREFLFTIVNTLDADYFPKQLQSIECERR